MELKDSGQPSYLVKVVILSLIEVCLSYFFFQAEDGIRDYKVTGVQTCALPISVIFLILFCSLKRNRNMGNFH